MATLPNDLLNNPILGLKAACDILPSAHGSSEKLGGSYQSLLNLFAPSCVHECFFSAKPDAPTDEARRRKFWFSPLTLFTSLASEFLRKDPEKRIVWIGRNCWPTFQVLSSAAMTESSAERVENTVGSSVFLDPQSDQERFWAIGQALRCHGVGAVIADGSGINETVSRRLQLAAESAGVLSLLSRPPWEIETKSWAKTRWQISPHQSDTDEPCWKITLVRKKGKQDASNKFLGQWSYEVFCDKGTFGLSSNVGRGSPNSEENPQKVSRIA